MAPSHSKTIANSTAVYFNAFYRECSLPTGLLASRVSPSETRDRTLFNEHSSICGAPHISGWGAPRIHGELLLLGFDVAERTISRYLPRRPSGPDTIRRWKAFLKLHQKGLVALDFFTVPTVGFLVLYVLVFLHHHRRRVVHWAVTSAPTVDWIRQQLREAFPYDTVPRYLILDRDALFDHAVLETIRAFGAKPVRTARRSPWQNGILERWIGSVRRELLDHVVVFHARHLHRVLTDYVAYYLDDRPHLALDKDAPSGRPVDRPPRADAEIVAFPRVGGLHHRYGWRAAA